MTADSFAQELRQLRQGRGFTLRALAERAAYSKSYIGDLESGRKPASLEIAHRLDVALTSGGRLAAALRPPADEDVEAEIEALDLARRVTASDVSDQTLDQLERAVDTMAMSYATIPPGHLLPRVRRHLRYVDSLVDARKTLPQQGRLLNAGGWLSLLRATLHIDLQQAAAADAFLDAAEEFAGQTGHREIAAWCLETRAWDALTRGDYRSALQQAQHAQEVAPRSSSAFIQATAQEGRVWARLGDRAQTGLVLARVERMAEHWAMPDQPEHHYKYDPGKAHAYAATTLAWAGDPAAESVARDVIGELVAEGARPRRIASAKLDLGLALLSGDQPDEAAALAREAMSSGRIVPSNWWRVTEVVAGVEQTGAIEGRDLREEYEAARPIESA